MHGAHRVRATLNCNGYNEIYSGNSLKSWWKKFKTCCSEEFIALCDRHLHDRMNDSDIVITTILLQYYYNNKLVSIYKVNI